MSGGAKRGFFAELKQRSVVRVGLMYAASAFVILQLADMTFPAFALPDWSYRLVIWLLALGFPLALVLAWVFDLTPDGIVRTSQVSEGELQKLRRSGRFSVVVIALLVAALVLMFVQRQQGPAVQPGASDVHPSIAVLPFANMSADPDNAFFADGIAEEVLNVLAKTPGLQVAARTASFRYRDGTKDPRQIGQELNVAYMLEGSVRRSADSVRVTVQLIRTDTAYHLWSENYEAPLTDVFRIQDRIATNVSQALTSTLYAETVQNAARASTSNPEAYELYVQARQMRGADWPRTLQYARQATELDPRFVHAYALLAEAYSTRVGGSVPAEEAFARAREAVDVALAVDPDDPEVLLALGRVERAAHDYTAAEKVYRRVKALAPNRVTIDLGNLLLALGRVDEALVEFRNSRALDPVNSANAYLQGLLAAGQIEQALGEVESMSALSSLVADLPLFMTSAMSVYSLAGQHAKAVELADKLLPKLNRNAFLRRGNIAYIYARAGERDKATAIVRELEQMQSAGYVSPSALFWAHLGLGDTDQAFTWLDRAIDDNSFLVIMGLKSYPEFEPLRADPRYRAMLTKAGLQ